MSKPLRTRVRHWWWGGMGPTRARMIWDFGCPIIIFSGRNEGDPCYLAWEFKKEDCWCGVFWSRKSERPEYWEGKRFRRTLHVWVCLIPCFPIHFARDIAPY
jgi:hypothetical protein